MNNLRLEYLDPSELDDNPSNWRQHPDKQITDLTDIIAEVGWAGALLYNEQTGRLIDGHCRKRIADGKVPVLIGSWTEEQERIILATFDPISAMAEANTEKLEELLGELESSTAAMQDVLAGVALDYGITPDDGKEYDESCADDVDMMECPICGHKFPK